MESKTPVALLQELVLKKGGTPDYLLVHNGVGTHNPVFIYNVTALDRTAMGKGKSKREAKHAAARALLLLLNEEDTPDIPKLDEVVQSPYADVLKDNAVGALQEFCANYSLNPPTYEQTRDEGLPHAKLFGVRCRVSNLSTVAEARTKKQAKQSASHIMLLKLKECLDEKTLEQFCIKEPPMDKTTMDDLAIRKAKAALEQDTKSPQSATPIGATLDLYDQMLKQDLYMVSDRLNKLKSKDPSDLEEMDDPLNVLKEMLNELDLQFNTSAILTKRNCSYEFHCIVIPMLNCATFFGNGEYENDALESAARNALKWFSVMAK